MLNLSIYSLSGEGCNIALKKTVYHFNSLYTQSITGLGLFTLTISSSTIYALMSDEILSNLYN